MNKKEYAIALLVDALEKMNGKERNELQKQLNINIKCKKDLEYINKIFGLYQGSSN